MPVYQRHRLLHIHIPKTGGTAVEQLFHQLDDMTWNPRSLYGHHFGQDRWFELQHLTNTEQRQHSGDDYEDFDRFAIVRDPYQRLISDFLWRGSIAATYPEADIEGFDTFDEFMAAIPSGSDTPWAHHFHGAGKTRTNLLTHTRPQYQYLLGADSVADPSIVVMRFEDLPGSIEPFLQQRGIVNHQLRTPSHRAVGDYFTPATIRIANDIYVRDFETFSYPMVSENSL